MRHRRQKATAGATGADVDSRAFSLPRVVLALRVPLQLRRVVVHLPQIPGRVSLRFIVEVLRPDHAALAPNDARLPHVADGNPTGMLGPLSSNDGVISSFSRWNRLISPHGVFQL